MKRCRQSHRFSAEDVVKQAASMCNELSRRLDYTYHCTLMLSPIGDPGKVGAGVMMSTLDDPEYIKKVIEGTLEHLKSIKKEPK